MFRLSRGGSWIFRTKLTANDERSNDFFGWGAVLSPSYLAVSSRTRDGGGGGLGLGAVYIYQLVDDTGDDGEDGDDGDGTGVGEGVDASPVLQVKLQSSQAEYFGNSLDLFSNTIIIGASGNKATLVESVYIFSAQMVNDKFIWVQEARFLPNKSNSNFGFSVSMCGGVAVIGAISADGGASAKAGSVFAFHRGVDSGFSGFPMDSNTFVTLITVLPLFLAIVLVFFIFSVCFFKIQDYSDTSDISSIRHKWSPVPVSFSLHSDFQSSSHSVCSIGTVHLTPSTPSRRVIRLSDLRPFKKSWKNDNALTAKDDRTPKQLDAYNLTM